MAQKNSIDCIPLLNWKDIEEKEALKDRWLYRGETISNGNKEKFSTKTISFDELNENSNLMTSFDKLFKGIKVYSKRQRTEMPIIERALVSEFKRRFHQYSKYIPRDNYNLEWLSLMRHYEAPTRLLDWTYSFYIALYFALEHHQESDYVVWAIDMDWVIEKARNLICSRYGSEAAKILVDKVSFSLKFNQVFKKAFLNQGDEIAFVYLACPSRLTERMTVQKGVFLCQGNIKKSFLENLCAMEGWKGAIKGYVIEHEMKHEFLNRLYDMNITRTSLFPGLDGFAKSLSVFHHIFRTKTKNTGGRPYEEWKNSKVIWEEI